MAVSQSDLQRALEVAYRYLNRRERSIAEVRRRLDQADIPTAASDAALEILIDQGYVDDARYARLFTEDKRELAQWGCERIRRALRGRGIDRELIDEVLGGAAAGEDRERAIGLLRVRFASPPRSRRDRDRA